MIVYALYIISKSGGVIFYQVSINRNKITMKAFSKDAAKLGMNDTLRLGSTFHG